MSMYRASFKEGDTRKVLWQEMLRHEFAEALSQDPVVIVPTGSVEQHGPHCPVDVDIAGPFEIAVAVARAVTEFPVIVAPPLSLGFAHYNLGHEGTITLRLETYQAVLADVLRSLAENGFLRIVVINGHGGNRGPNRSVIAQVAEDDIFPIGFSYWEAAMEEMAAWAEADGGWIGHGGEWETSLMMHLRPQLIDRERMGADTFPNPYSEDLRAFAEYAERRRDTGGRSGIMGNALVATPEKGERLFNLLVEKTSRLVREMHAAPVRGYLELYSEDERKRLRQRARLS
jgi:creatinine amidohydrolase